MSTTRRWSAVLCLALLTGFAWAQGAPGDDSGRRPGRRPGGPQSLFLTDQIIERVIDRLTDEMSQHYGFDDDQLYNTRAIMKQRFPEFVSKHREEIIGVVNDYFAALLGDDPPDPSDVAQWSQRVTPLVQEFNQLVGDTTEDMRVFLTDEQQVKLDGELAMYDVGMNQLNQRLNHWSSGGYDWETEWPRSEKFRETEQQRERQLEEQQRKARNEVMGLPSDTPIDPQGAPLESGGEGGAVAQPKANKPADKPTPGKSAQKKDEWDLYVDDFIRRYQLSTEQQEQAQRVLRSVREARDQYLRRKGPDIAALEKRMAATQPGTERDQLRSEYQRLNAPVERYFDQLKERLARIPTRKQRADAAQSEIKTQLPADKGAAPTSKPRPAESGKP